MLMMFIEDFVLQKSTTIREMRAPKEADKKK
jgi:hypothetical protein